MTDVVGLRFVSEGGEKAVQDLNKYKNAQNDLASATQKNITFSQRNAAQLRSVAQAYASGAITLREAGNLTEDLAQRTTALARAAGATDAQIVSLVQRFNEMADAALSAARAQEAAADYERRIAAQMAFNEQLGVSGKLATEMGASFTQFATVLDNLDAAARQFTTDLNQRLGVTGQRATQAGASFSQFAAVLDNIEASARRFTSELNDRLGVTGQRAIQAGAGYEALEADIRSAETALKNFQASFDPTAAAARRLENAQTVLANAVRTGAITQEESNRIMQQYRGALDDTAKSNEILRRETQALAMAYNPVMAAQIAYERKQQELNRAHELGVISADKLQAELAQLTAAYNSIGGSTLNAQRFTNQFGENVRIAGIKTNRFGMVAQQVGYQVGDFFVQIQSGTNAFVAFGQQATQLAGLLPGLAGAVVGISISVGTMLLGAYDRARRAAEEFEDTTFDINEAAKSATEELKNYREELAKLSSEYETLGEIGLDRQIKTLEAELKNLEGRRADIISAAATGFGAAGGMMSGADLEDLVGDALRENTDEIENQIRLKQEQLRQLVLERDSVEAVKKQLEEQNRLLKDGARAVLERNSSFRQAKLELERELKLIQLSTQYGEESVEVARQRAYYEAVMREYTEEQRNAYIALVLKIREAETAEKRRQEALRAGADAFAAHVAAYREEQIAAAEAVADQQAALLEENTRFEEEQARKRAVAQAKGDASRIAAINLYYDNLEKAEAERERVEAARAAIRKQRAEEDAALQKAMNQQVADQQAALLEENARYEQEVVAKREQAAARHLTTQAAIYQAYADSRTEADALSKSLVEAYRAGEDLSSADVGAGVDAAAVAAAELARQMGISLSLAQGMVALGSGLAAPGGPDQARENVRNTYSGIAGLREEDIVARFTLAARDAPRPGRGGAAREQEDYLAGLLAEAEQKRRLVGLDEEETRRREILFELKKRELPLDDARIARIEQIIKAEAETRKLIEAERQREQLMQTIEGNIKSAFMTMVDGSASVEDAFRNMLRNIILAIYEQKVAQPAAEAIGSLIETGISALFKADGGAFNRGVEFYANGGVVNAPTGFRHSGGLGVMGEAGPEAIMPLKRGKDGKLGVQAEGGGAVVVNNYFNMSANGDESVKRIIRGEMPRITEATKAAVVDAKRRGGSYGRSF